MVGNDVVDLADREAAEGATHPRFDARVFSQAEQRTLRASGSPSRLRWMLWAAKEAAYKLTKKVEPGSIFAPSRFDVHLEGSMHGRVLHEGRELALVLCADGHAVHAIAAERATDFDHIVSAFLPARRPDESSREVRELAARTLAQRMGVPARAVRIERRGRIPRLEVRGHAAAFDLSLSHHGRFVAFACDLGDAA